MSKSVWVRRVTHVYLLGLFALFPVRGAREAVQLDELYTVLREVKAGDLSDDEAIKRLLHMLRVQPLTQG